MGLSSALAAGWLQINDSQTLKGLGIDPKSVGWALVKVFAELMLIRGFVHGDPHSGNLMVSAAAHHEMPLRGFCGWQYSL